MNSKMTLKIPIQVSLITNEADFVLAKKIRYQVFVEEQLVSSEDEFDEFEDSSRHFLALQNNNPVGTARWRKTEKGIKLERFAVSESARGYGVGSALVKAILTDIQNNIPQEKDNPLLYLHGQVTAMKLYAKFGFEKVGDKFDECSIQHYKMIRFLY